MLQGFQVTFSLSIFAAQDCLVFCVCPVSSLLVWIQIDLVVFPLESTFILLFIIFLIINVVFAWEKVYHDYRQTDMWRLYYSDSDVRWGGCLSTQGILVCPGCTIVIGSQRSGTWGPMFISHSFLTKHLWNIQDAAHTRTDPELGISGGISGDFFFIIICWWWHFFRDRLCHQVCSSPLLSHIITSEMWWILVETGAEGSEPWCGNLLTNGDKSKASARSPEKWSRAEANGMFSAPPVGHLRWRNATVSFPTAVLASTVSLAFRSQYSCIRRTVCNDTGAFSSKTHPSKTNDSLNMLPKAFPPVVPSSTHLGLRTRPHE